MTVELICLAPRKGMPLQLRQSVDVFAHAGIVGDRYLATRQKVAGQNLTLVEAEEIERFSAELDVSLPLEATRRNLVTRGVRLNALVHREFTVGTVRLRGVELCEPCSKLARHLGHTRLSPQQIVRAFVHRAGLRADVLSSGRISRGDPIVEVEIS